MRCAACGREHEVGELDRLLWCRECLEAARSRARVRGAVVGLVAAGALAVWIFGFLRPTVIVGGWVGVVLGGFWVGARVGREVFFGIERNRT